MDLELNKNTHRMLDDILNGYFGGGRTVSNVLAFNGAASAHKAAEVPVVTLNFTTASLGR